jgi:histidinol dehydrogenase
MPITLKSANLSSSASNGPTLDVSSIVRSVIEDIRQNGDNALRSYSEKFDKWSPESFKLSKEQIDEIVSTVPAQVIEDIKTVQQNVRTFAEEQRKSITDFEYQIQPGVFLGQKNIPMSAIGAYVLTPARPIHVLVWAHPLLSGTFPAAATPSSPQRT